MQTLFTILLVVCGIFLVITFIVGIDSGGSDISSNVGDQPDTGGITGHPHEVIS